MIAIYLLLGVPLGIRPLIVVFYDIMRNQYTHDSWNFLYPTS